MSSEVKKIQAALKKKGRLAFNRAKENNNAYIVIDDAIYRVYSDGRRELIQRIGQTEVRTDKKEIQIG